MRIAIIEDEPMTAQDLAADLLQLRPGWQVVATWSSVWQVVERLPNTHGIDLIFSDIQLGDGTCFDAYSQVPPPAPVIFCTAFNQYALQAFQANGIGYLLKPHSREHLLAAIEKFERLRPQAPDISALLSLLQASTGSSSTVTAPPTPNPEPPKPKSLLVHHRDRIIPVPIADVALFYLHHEQTMLLRWDGSRHAVEEGLSDIEEMAGQDYFRASRQHLVHRRAILEAHQYFGRKLLLSLTVATDEQVTVSKEKVPGFLAWLRGS